MLKAPQFTGGPCLTTLEACLFLGHPSCLTSLDEFLSFSGNLLILEGVGLHPPQRPGEAR